MQEHPAYNINLEKTDNDIEERDKMQTGTDLNGDNLRIYRAYLRISDHCRVTVRVRNMVRVRDKH